MIAESAPLKTAEKVKRKYGPKESFSGKAYKFRLYPTKTVERELDYWLYLCRRLYNTMLDQRITAYRMSRKISLNYYDQQNELPKLRHGMPEYGQMGSNVLQNVARRVDTSFQRFFKNGAGFPKFQGRHRYNSITYPSTSNWKLIGDRLLLTTIGTVKVELHRPIEGQMKTLAITRQAGQWFVVITCDSVPKPNYPATDSVVGIDVGIESLAVTSDGEVYENSKFLNAAQKRLRRLNRKLARQKDKSSKRRAETVRQLQKLHMHIANQRKDAHHKASTDLVKKHAIIIREDISPKFMLQNKHLARSASDVGWGQFTAMLETKAKAAGRTVVTVNPRNTSQICSGCGRSVPKSLRVRTHSCPHCGLELHRDKNAAINIRERGLLTTK